MQQVMFLLASYGICFGLVNKATFLRRVGLLDRMLDCSYCTGFHAGWIASLVMLPIAGFEWPTLVLSAFASAAFCYIIDTAVILLEEKTADLKSRKASDHHNLFG